LLRRFRRSLLLDTGFAGDREKCAKCQVLSGQTTFVRLTV
jgi:hypothetical protein